MRMRVHMRERGEKVCVGMCVFVTGRESEKEIESVGKSVVEK